MSAGVLSRPQPGNPKGDASPYYRMALYCSLRRQELANMPTKSDTKGSEENLTVEQISAIGMNALMGMGVKATSGLTNGVLRYETGIDGEKSDLDLMDLAAVMLPRLQHSDISVRNVQVGGDSVIGDKKVFTVEMESSGLFACLGKGSISAVHEFIGYFIVEIRRIVCKNKKSSQNLGHTTTGALAALAAWVVESFHVGSHVATAVAAGVLVTVMTATKASFCKMTKDAAIRYFPKPDPKAKKKLK